MSGRTNRKQQRQSERMYGEATNEQERYQCIYRQIDDTITDRAYLIASLGSVTVSPPVLRVRLHLCTTLTFVGCKPTAGTFGRRPNSTTG